MSSSATTYETIAVETQGAVATIALNRPQALNAFTIQMGTELGEALDTIAADSSLRAVILTGTGRGFSAGADMKEPRNVPPTASGRPDLGWALREVYNPTILKLREMPQPVVAAVNGPAAGIGFSYALACDYIVAARSAYFLLAFIKRALVPDGGSSLLVAARAGLGRQLEMGLLGDKVSAEDGLAWNLVNKVVDDEQLLPAAMEIAQRFADGPPVAQAAVKALINAPLLEDLRAQLTREAEAQTLRSESDEVVEAIMAFIQKRPASFGS